MSRFDLLFANPKLRTTISDRMVHLDLSIKDICTEAKKLGIKGLNPSSLSRFFAQDSGKKEGTISQANLLYLMTRLGIKMKIQTEVKEIDINEAFNEAVRLHEDLLRKLED